jgi:sugar phosphate isomerase/epimerase
MKIGVFLGVFGRDDLEAALQKAKQLSLDTVEIGTGNYAGEGHCNLKRLLHDKDERDRFLEAISSRGLQLSALSCHGNPVHPNPEIAGPHHQVFEDTVRLAKLLGITVVNNFSGTPGGGPDDRTPNWITCPWPNEYSEALKWQWEQRLIPYWKRMAAFCDDHGVVVGLEMHPGMCVYNPETLLRLRTECGKSIGANFDPSHLFWQAIDPIVAVRELQGAIFHVHAKDTMVYRTNADRNGVLDTKPYLDEARRSWIFRTVGYGHGLEFWNDFVSTLRMAGYDGTLSIEHEDSLMSGAEGLGKAIDLLKKVVIREPVEKVWWT